MKIFLPPLEIGDEEGFAPEKDLFGRKSFGDGLTRLITNVDDPLVIALDGQWGSGKTTFLRMWAGELRKEEFPVVFFDAFAHDYMSDAFTALAGQIIALAEKKKKSEGPQTIEFVDKATRVGKILLRSSLKIGIKAATLGALSGDDVEGVAKDAIGDIAKEASNLEDKYIGELLTKQTEEKEAIEGFKAALRLLSGSLANEASDTKNNLKPTKKPLVFIIDELDRCRPDFALSLMERIKHFFATNGVYFVVGVYYPQICSSVRLCYGQDVDADYYLQKFFQIKLDINSDSTYGSSAEEYIKFLTKEHGLETHDFKNHIEGMLLMAAKKRRLSLRTLERIMSNICLALAFEFDYSISPIVFGLLIMKVSSPEIYEKAKRGELQFNEAIDSLGLVDPSTSREHLNRYAYLLWRQAIVNEPDYQKNDGIQEMINHAKVICGGKDQLVAWPLSRIVDRLIIPGQ